MRLGTERQQVERALRESREGAPALDQAQEGGDEIERLLSMPASIPA